MPSTARRSKPTARGPRKTASVSQRSNSSAVTSPDRDNPSPVMSAIFGVSRSIVASNVPQLPHLIIPIRLPCMSLSFLGETNNCNVSSALDCDRQFPLMPHAVTRDPAGHNASPLSQEIAQQSRILKIDRRLLQAKPAGPSALEQSPSASAAISSLHHGLLVTSRLAVLFKFITGILWDGHIATASTGPTGVLPFGHEGDGLRHDFMLATLLAIFSFPPALLQ